MTTPDLFASAGPLLTALNIVGTFVFAASGALAAARLKQTLVTFSFFALATGVGGGTVRDLLIGAPVFWVHDISQPLICLGAAFVVYVTPGRLWSLRALDWLDAVGLAAFAVFGTAKAMSYGVHPFIAALMGVSTACVGGIIRDLLAGVPSIVLRPEIYVTAAALSAALYALMVPFGMPTAIAGTIAALAGFGLRALAIAKGLALPSYDRRSDAEDERGQTTMDIPDDIFTEQDADPDTLAHLGPLRRFAGIWEGQRGIDLNPKAEGPERREYQERIVMQPIDAQANGPQLFYGLRYHLHINTVEEETTFHDQTGYWLWEPDTGLILQTVSIPRGQVALAAGHAAIDDKKLVVEAKRGDTDYGICSTTFLELAFRTDSYRLEVTFHEDGTWSYISDTILIVKGREAPFQHRDRNRLTKVGEVELNPWLKRVQAGGAPSA